MKLESFGISNFKAFGASIQKLPMKPLTLVFGPNSAGKSSLIQGLLWTLHLAKGGDFESRVSESASGSVDLGSFRTLLHQKDQGRRIEIEFSFSNGPVTLPVKIVHQLGITTRADLQSFYEKLNSELKIAVDYENVERLLSNARDLIKCLFLYNEPEAEEVMRIILNDEACEKQIETCLQHQVEAGWRELEGFESLGGRRPVPEDIVKAYRDSQEAWKQLRAIRSEHGDQLQAHWQHVNRIIEQETDRCSVLAIEIYHGESLVLRATRPPGKTELEVLDGGQAEGMVSPPDPGWIDSFSHAANGRTSTESLFYPYKVGLKRANSASVSDHVIANALAWLSHTRQHVRNLEEGLIYLGPLRHLPERRSLIGIPGEPPADPKLKTWAHLRDQPSLQKQVNHLLERLECRKYRFQTKLFSTARDFWEARDSLNVPKWGFTKSDFDETDCMVGFDKEWTGKIEQSIEDLHSDDEEAAYTQIDEHLKNSPSAEVWADLVLFDIENKTSVSMRDVGVGISQIAPILIHSCAGRNKLIAIEQPELHLHPALQGELGDVFIESALGENKNSFLLETHSEHLLLRIMKRMRQTAEGKLPEGMPPLRPEDVALLFVSPGHEGSVVQDIGLNERGELIKAWPGGFFEEGFNEMFD